MSSPAASAIPDTKFLEGILKREYVVKDDIRRGMAFQNDAYRKGRRDFSLLDALLEIGAISQSQAEHIRSDIEQGRSFNLHVPGFRITAKVGEGGMGMVYRARQSSLTRDVALKVLHEKHCQDKTYLERFQEEAVTTAQINHPHVVGVVDVGMDRPANAATNEGRHYIIMEFIDGVDLSVEMQRRGKLPELETAKIGLDVARALAHLHRVGYIHRDVKPQNIMITTDRIAKLTDMGLARGIHDQVMIDKEKGKALGTPDYISPESIMGQSDLDGRADQYCLGGTLYHVVTGQVPFPANLPKLVMGRHLNDPLTPPTAVRSDLKAGLSEVIEVLMAKDRRNRYSSSEDMVRDFEAIVAGRAPLIAYSKLGREVPASELFGDYDPDLEASPEPEPEPPEESAPPSDRVDQGSAKLASSPSQADSADPHARPPASGSLLWVLVALSVLANAVLALLAAKKFHLI